MIRAIKNVEPVGWLGLIYIIIAIIIKGHLQ